MESSNSTTSYQPSSVDLTETPLPIPPLVNGDELSRDEFERRYHAMPEVNKAELIEGIVYMPSPVRYDKHGLPHARMMHCLTNYEWQTPGVLCCDGTTVRLDMKNEPQPDALLMTEPRCGGRVKLNEGYIEGSPELVAEVSGSTVSIDLNAKFRAYHRNEVQEYLVWRVDDRAIDWFALEGSEYRRLTPNDQGIVCSRVFPGLWIDVAALVEGNLTRVAEVLKLGLADPSHQAFITALANRASDK